MSSFIFKTKPIKNSIDYKSRLEYKLYLCWHFSTYEMNTAREDPEPVFDLSECNLKSVPSGIYSLCRVFRKERLLLQVNQLSSLSGGGQLSDLCLLTALNLHKNRFSTLPEEIGHLYNLEELNISSNEIKKLPESLGSLVKLRLLDCSDNRLRCLPDSVGRLSCLACLDLRGNPALTCLPPSLGQAVSLQQLLVSPSLQEPPSSVVQQGTAAVLHYLSQGTREKYSAVSLSAGKSQESISLMGTEESGEAQDSFKLLGKKKEEKLQELLEVEKTLQEQKFKEYEMHENIKKDKSKLLVCLKEQQKKLEEDVTKFHIQKEQERTKLMNHLLEVENRAEEAIKDLLTLNQALQQTSCWQEQEWKDQQLFTDYKSRSTELRRRQVIDAMESLLAEECSRKEKFLAYEKDRTEVIQNSLIREVEWSEQVSALMCARGAHQTALLSAVEADTEIQKALVATLLERSDLHSQSLVMQVALVEQQLAVLTAVELQRRNIDSQQHLSDLAEKRKTLSELLVELLQEQRRRHLQLMGSLQQLDTDRQVCESSADFWLRQYQHLLDIRPQQLRTTLDPLLVHQLVVAGVAHCLPFLVCCHVQSLTQTQLKRIGVTNEDDRVAVLQAVNAYLSHSRAQHLPSAPPQDAYLSHSRAQHLPSAPPQDKPSAPPPEPLPECIVCMEAECAVVFVPCGHLCTCAACATQLSLCPLCRASLERKIHIILP